MLKLAIGIGLAGAGALALVYAARRVASFGASVGISGNTFNPASDQNAAYSIVNAGVRVVTGDQNQTLGGAIFDYFNPNAGLAPNEYSPANGIIITKPRASVDVKASNRYASILANTMAG